MLFIFITFKIITEKTEKEQNTKTIVLEINTLLKKRGKNIESLFLKKSIQSLRWLGNTQIASAIRSSLNERCYKFMFPMLQYHSFVHSKSGENPLMLSSCQITYTRYVLQKNIIL